MECFFVTFQKDALAAVECDFDILGVGIMPRLDLDMVPGTTGTSGVGSKCRTRYPVHHRKPNVW